MSSVFHLQRKQSLPLSFTQSTTTTTTTGQEPAGIRRRLSSLSLNLKIQAPPAAAWASFRRSKSVTDYAGSSIRKWWNWGWGWILSRKPTFASDLEMNEEETAALGTHSKGTWRHVFCKVTSQLRRKLGGADNVGLPQTFRYDSLDYSKNFDNGKSPSFIH